MEDNFSIQIIHGSSTICLKGELAETLLGLMNYNPYGINFWSKSQTTLDCINILINEYNFDIEIIEQDEGWTEYVLNNPPEILEPSDSNEGGENA